MLETSSSFIFCSYFWLYQYLFSLNTFFIFLLFATHMAVRGEMKQVCTFLMGNPDVCDFSGDLDVGGGQY